jgi:hypothetical protein
MTFRSNVFASGKMRTKSYENAVGALRNLLRDADVKTVQCAFAEAVHSKIEDEYCKKHGVKESFDHYRPEALVGKTAAPCL